MLCHLPNVDGQIDPSSTIVHVVLWYMWCEQSSRITTMLIYGWCSKGWYMGCLIPLVKGVLVGNYFALGAKINQETFVVIW